MILRFEIEAARFAPAGKLDVCALIRANGHVLGRQVRNGKQHSLQFLADCAVLSLQFGHAFFEVGDLSLQRFGLRSEEHTSELQSLMRISYAVFCLKKKTNVTNNNNNNEEHKIISNRH